MDTSLYTKSLDDAQRLQFDREFKRKVKSKNAGIVLAVLLGGIGIHRFYMGEVGMGIVYLIFSFTFVPLVVGIIEAIFYMGKRVEAHNDVVAQEIVLKLKAMT